MYRLLYDNRISKDFKSIPKETVAKILKVLEALPQNPRCRGTEKLAGVSGYRYRVWNYRILFRIDDKSKTITVYKIAHRRESYR